MTEENDPAEIGPGPAADSTTADTVPDTPATGADETGHDRTPPAPPRRGGVALLLAALAGGAFAAVFGFGLAHYDVFGLRPSAPPDPTARIAALDARIDGLSGGIAEAKETAAAALDATRAAAAGAGKDALSLAPLAARLDALEASVAALPEGGTGTAAADPDTLRALIREELDARGAAESAADKAATQAAQATAQREAAFQALKEALASGAPYAAALATLAPEAPPPALARHAEAGLPTLATLTESFPDAARDALAASLRAGNADEGIADQFWAFLRAETGARSLTPQEGDDPDAVLSRAEAAVAAGDLAAALAELAALPPAGHEAMAAWAALAQDHLDAEAALAGLDAPAPAPDTSANP